ncbi:MAG TPA: YIP1 family protein [Rubrobacteraceae bacterium]|nr:YIP1 family protein [Rubrobacteraceae bacterium]
MFRRRAEPSVNHSPEDFWGALRGVWFAPRRFFERLDPAGGFVRPALFASIVLYLNLLLEAALQAVWLQEFNFALIYAPFLGLVVALVLGPLLVAGLSVLVLVVLEGAPSRRGFGPVFRALGYASGIGAVLWVPYAPLLAIPYGALVATVAVKEALDVGWGRAAAGALIPLAAVLLILLLLTGPSEAAGSLLNPPGS